jgi:hypothetical protein
MVTVIDEVGGASGVPPHAGRVRTAHGILTATRVDPIGALRDE